MIHSVKVWKISAAVLSAVLFVLLFFRRSSPEFFLSGLSFPLLPLAKGLRDLSLKGGFYNILAWLIYGVVSLSPLYPLMLRKKKEWYWRELISVALSGLLFLSLYQLINPGVLNEVHGEFGKTEFMAPFFGGIFYSLALSYLLLSVLGVMGAKDRKKLFQHAQIGLFVVFLTFVFQVTGPFLWQWISSAEGLVNGSTDLMDTLTPENLSISQFFLFMRYLLAVLPYALGIPLLYKGASLLESAKSSVSEEAALLSESLGAGSIRMLKITIAGNLMYQLLQLLFLSTIHSVEVSILLPVLPMLVSLAMYLLTVLLRENKALQEDNDLFI